MDLLSGSDSDSCEKGQNAFTINKKYAKSYDKWRRKEEKQKLIDKYGDDVNSSSESDDEEITSNKTLDKEWLRAYAVVRFNQPRLYTGEKLINTEVLPASTKKTDKTVTLKDHERKFILEKGGVASEDEDDDNTWKNAGPSYFEEQEEIKSSLKKAIGEIDDDEDDDDGGNDDSLFVKKTKTLEEQKEEENDYLAWLKGEKEELEDKQASEELAPLKAYWNDPNLTDKERVLRDYILNNGYMDKEGSDDDDDDDSDDDGAFDFDDEEDFLDQADKYEKIYNFRHEEPGGTEIKTYPRVIESSVRAERENRRLEKRKRKAEKRQMEKEKRMEEIKVLQRLQREEKEQKLQKLKDLAENPELDYNLDTDFDPDEHDKLMKKYFDDNYYHDANSGKKPVFEEDEEMNDGQYGNEADSWWNQREQEQMELEEEMANDEELYADDPGFIMDADYDPQNTQVQKKSKKETKKSKKEAKKAKKIKKWEKAPLFDPTTKTFDEYLEEYLHDKISTLPFTYREVMPNDFGLSTEEILSAPDRELNAWVSVKKMSMYRDDHDEKHDIHKYRMKSRNTHKKHKILPSLNPNKSVKETVDVVVPKKKKKKKKANKDNEDDGDDKLSPSKDNSHISDETPVKKKGKKRLLNQDDNDADDDKKDSGGIVSVEPEKKKKKLLKKSKEEILAEFETPKVENGPHDEAGSSSVIKKKNKGDKSKRTQDIVAVDLKKESDNTPKVKSKKATAEVETVMEKTDDSNTDQNSLKLKKKKKKKDKKYLDEGELNKTEKSVAVEQNDASVKDKGKKHKKKKSKASFKISEPTEHNPVAVTDKRKMKENLKKVMSASRLGSYGLGPGANKHANKLGKKKKKKSNPPS